MTPDETTPISPETPAEPAAEAAPAAAEPTFRKIGPTIAAKIGGDDVQANLSAVGSISAGALSATGSLVGLATVEGETTITASMTPAVITKGDTTIQQSYASAIIVGGGANTTVHQAASPIIVGKTMDVSQSAGCMLVTGEADVKKSWVGVVVAPKATFSEDSRVLISTTAALIIAAALLGGFGLVALAITVGVRRIMHWRPTINVPGIKNLPQLPDIATLQERWHQMRHAA